MRSPWGELFLTSADLPQSPGHAFYDRLNALLAEGDFDRFVEDRCRPHYADEVGRPSLPPGTYFRMLFVGYFEGLDSQRGIAWRCADSLSLRAFLGIPFGEASPDHSSRTRIRKRLPEVIHEQVFARVLALAREKKLLRGQTVGVDSTTLEANAAMRAIVRKDTGEDYKASPGVTQVVLAELRSPGEDRPVAVTRIWEGNDAPHVFVPRGRGRSDCA